MVYEIVRKVEEKGKIKEQFVRTEIVIAGKTIELRFTMPIWKRMEQEICTMEELYTMLHGAERFQEDKLPYLICMMSGDVITPKVLLRECTPADMRALIDEVERVMATAVTMREKKYDDDSVHDEVLEEIEKKDPQAD